MNLRKAYFVIPPPPRHLWTYFYVFVLWLNHRVKQYVSVQIISTSAIYRPCPVQCGPTCANIQEELCRFYKKKILFFNDLQKFYKVFPHKKKTDFETNDPFLICIANLCNNEIHRKMQNPIFNKVSATSKILQIVSKYKT